MTKGELKHLLCRTKTHFRLTFQVYISKSQCEDAFDQVTEILYEALNRTQPQRIKPQIFFTH